MQTSFRPLTARQKAELQGYVGRGAPVARAILFVITAGVVLKLFQVLHSKLVGVLPIISHPAWWIVPSTLLMVYLYVVSRRWTGGRRLRKQVKSDLAEGKVAAHLIVAVDAIEVEELEDEGPSYFVKTVDGETILFTGQYLEGYKSKGFPWKSFEILEAPTSKVFFGLKRLAEPLRPSFVRQPFTWDEDKQFGCLNKRYGRLEVDFETLRTKGAQRGAAVS